MYPWRPPHEFWSQTFIWVVCLGAVFLRKCGSRSGALTVGLDRILALGGGGLTVARLAQRSFECCER